MNAPVLTLHTMFASSPFITYQKAHTAMRELCTIKHDMCVCRHMSCSSMASGSQKFEFVLRYEELSRMESVCFLSVGPRDDSRRTSRDQICFLSSMTRRGCTCCIPTWRHILHSMFAPSGKPITARIVSRICMHTRRESADRFQMDRISS